jgi:hypothetical protein
MAVKRPSAVYPELDTGNILADLRQDLAAQPVMLLVLVVDTVSTGVLPVIGNRKIPPAVTPTQVDPDAYREHPGEPERGDSRQASWSAATSAACWAASSAARRRPTTTLRITSLSQPHGHTRPKNRSSTPYGQSATAWQHLTADQNRRY